MDCLGRREGRLEAILGRLGGLWCLLGWGLEALGAVDERWEAEKAGNVRSLGKPLAVFMMCCLWGGLFGALLGATLLGALLGPPGGLLAFLWTINSAGDSQSFGGHRFWMGRLSQLPALPHLYCHRHPPGGTGAYPQSFGDIEVDFGRRSRRTDGAFCCPGVAVSSPRPSAAGETGPWEPWEVPGELF